MDQKAGQMPWREAPAVPSLNRDWTIIWVPVVALKEAIVSMRQDVQAPVEESSGMMRREELVTWQLSVPAGSGVC